MEKIIICSPQLGMSPDSNLGGEVHDREVLRALADLGVEIHIILPLFKKHIAHRNFHFYYLPTPFVYPPWLFNLLILPYLFWIYSKVRFTILRVHSPRFVGLAALAFKTFFPNVKIVTTFHHLEEANSFDRLMVSRSDLVVTDSHDTKSDILKMTRGTVSPGKVVVISNAIDEKFRPHKKNLGMVSQYGLNGKTVLLYLGQLIKRKNVDFLIKVIEELPEKFVLLICGSGSESERIIKQSQQSQAKNRIIFAGRVAETKKVDLYNIADFFVYPSLKEGFGLSVVEAMATELPVAVSDLAVFREIVEDGENGLVLPLDPKKWSTRIQETLGNPEKVKGFKFKARKTSKMYRWENVAKTYLQATQAVLNRKR